MKNDEFTARGATLVAISMQGAQDSRKSREENKLNFPILTGQGGEVAHRFGLCWTLQPYLLEFHKMFKVELSTIHNDGKWNLAMPARYVIDVDGSVTCSEVNPEYTCRPDPADVFPVLDKIVSRAA